MRTSLRVFPALCLGVLLISACGGNGGLREAKPVPDGGVVPVVADAGFDLRLAPDAHADGAPALSDLPTQLCGNGTLDQGETCDDGNTLSGDGCSSRCELDDPWPRCGVGTPCPDTRVCGNGILTSNEACDDGNTQGGDGCSANCQAVEPGWRCRAPSRSCAPVCGDRVRKGSETCDDGNTLDGDGCSIYCLTEPGWDCTSGICVQVFALDGGLDSGAALPRCGDGIMSGAEECDEGAANDDDVYGGCTTKCFLGPFCGDGIRNGSEGCDLGTRNGVIDGKDGCTFGCTRPHYCGDGLVDTDRGEECDLGDLNGQKLDGNMQPTQDPDADGEVRCTPNCTIPIVLH